MADSPAGKLRRIALIGESVLRDRARPVAMPPNAEASTLLADMMATMLDASGVGIAAPQVFESARGFIVASRPNPRYPDAPSMEPEVVINPSIVDLDDAVVHGWEGCLSIPGRRGWVPRPGRVRARYHRLDGSEVDRTFEGFVARVFLHEFDHLEGILFPDRVETPDDVVTEAEYLARIAEPN